MITYGALIKIRFINGLQYRAAALAGIVTQYCFGFMFISQYLAFYRTNPSAFPMEVSHLVSYIWVQQAFMALYFSWFYENDIFAAIRNGHIAYDLARPVDLYGKWFCQSIGNRLSKAVLRCFPILIVAVFLPHPYRLIFPPDIMQLVYFILSTALTLGVVTAFSMFVYISTFYTMSPMGVRIIAGIMGDFLAGSIVPIPFFPDRFRQIAQLLPFAAMQNVPLRIYSGNIFGREALAALLFQLFWLAVLSVTGIFWMNKTIKRTIVQGG